jgi:hypothetical protein
VRPDKIINEWQKRADQLLPGVLNSTIVGRSGGGRQQCSGPVTKVNDIFQCWLWWK